MSPVAALIRVLAVRPRLASALAAGPGATALSAARLTPVRPAMGRPGLARMPLTWSGGPLGVGLEHQGDRAGDHRRGHRGAAGADVGAAGPAHRAQRGEG